MPLDTSKQASMYVKGYVQNIWERDASGEVVVPYNKTGEQFNQLEAVKLDAITMADLNCMQFENGILPVKINEVIVGMGMTKENLLQNIKDSTIEIVKNDNRYAIFDDGEENEEED